MSVRLSFGFCVLPTLSRSCIHMDVDEQDVGPSTEQRKACVQESRTDLAAKREEGRKERCAHRQLKASWFDKEGGRARSVFDLCVWTCWAILVQRA